MAKNKCVICDGEKTCRTFKNSYICEDCLHYISDMRQTSQDIQE